MASYDVTILGAGVFGLSIAYVLGKRGARVQVIDPNGVGQGASGGLVGALAPHTPDQWEVKKQFQFESLILSRQFWPEVEADAGLSTGYAPFGRIQVVAEPRLLPLAHARHDAALETWQGQADWLVEKADPDNPWCPQPKTGMIIRDTLAAHIHPKMAVMALAKAVQNMGISITPTGHPQGKVIEATGWQGLIKASEQTGKLVGNGVKGQAVLFDCAAPKGTPQVFLEGLHFIPHNNCTVAVGSTSERYFEDPTQTDAQLDDLITRARALMPVIADAPVIERWAHVRPRAITRAPLLGEHPVDPSRFIANGGFKIGLGMAPKMAKVMADLVLEGRNAIPAEFDAKIVVAGLAPVE